MTENPTAGQGNPYWYEWSVGQRYILEMLDPDSGIASVTLQKTTGDKGLDDVVVHFADGRTRFIQVKHTRAEASLTFGDLVTSDGTAPSLLRQITIAWAAESAQTSEACEAWLVTNRSAGRIPFTSRAAVAIVRPPLAQFLPHVEAEAEKAASLADIQIPDDWRTAWEDEWLTQLSDLQDEAHQLEFLKRFRIDASQEDLDALGETLLRRIGALFAVDRKAAKGLLGHLDSALREWATTLRGASEAVTRERAYTKLCLVDDALIGEHDLSPPEPFFNTRIAVADQLAALVLAGAAPIVFVVGEPGSGKTALLSALANRREPIIGVRYHAFRPITPESPLLPADAGATTTARALWSDLLIQLRRLLRGRLAELRVPVHARSLSVESLRTHVLRLANELGSAEGHPFVIAVDGIDHAARAGAPTGSFLGSLIPPSEVPPNVVFIIGGQPPEAYSAAYPLWLSAPTEGVSRLDLPRLDYADTLGIVRARIPAASLDEQENAARDVFARCEGHTLSTVFAVEEAVLVGSLDRLPSTLAERRVADGIERYYEVIWSAAVRDLPAGTALRLAACLSLMPVRTAGGAVQAALPSIDGIAADWADVLRRLRPLVSEEPGGFRVFHNDVRIFLHRQLSTDINVYQDAASRLADYLRDGEDAAARHAAAQRLFGIGGRPADQARLFTPEYVLEGHAIGAGLSTMREQGLVAAEALVTCGVDWDLTHAVATGLRTLEQLEASLGWRNASAASTGGTSSPPTKLAERRVPPRPEWSRDMVDAALDDIADLSGVGEVDRARGAFRRWFGGLSPAKVARVIRGKPSGRRDAGDRESVEALVRKLGTVSVATGLLLPPSRGKAAGGTEAAFAGGVLEGLTDIGDERAFVSGLRRLRHFYLVDVQKLLTLLVEQRSFRRCGLVLQGLAPQPEQPWPYRPQCASVAALLGSEQLRERWVRPVLEDRAAAIEGAVASETGHEEPTQLAVMAWTALLFGLEEPNRIASAIREEIEVAFRRRPRGEQRDASVAQVLHAAALLGSYVRTTRDGGRRAVHVEPNVVAQTLRVLMRSPREERFDHLAFGYPQVAAPLVQGLVECANRDAEVRNQVRPALREHLDAAAPDIFLEVVWRSLREMGYRRELLEFADRWVGHDGLAWREAPADRYDVVTRMAGLLEELQETELARAARSRLAWADIGYTGHKETVLRQPLEWFEALAALDPSSWEREGLRLLAVSHEASRTGDNRLASQVDDEVMTAACLQGPSALARVALASGGVLEPGDEAVLNGLLGMVRRTNVSRESLLAIWAFATGQLCWQVDQNRLVHTRSTILDAARRQGVEVAAVMETSAPAEFGAEPEKEEAGARSERDYAWVTEMPIVEAMQRACTTDDWDGIAAVIARMERERPPESGHLVETAWATLGRRRETSWWFYGVGPAYSALFPHLTPAQRWEGVRRAVLQWDRTIPVARSSTLAETLDDLCRLAAIASGRSGLEHGLQRLLQTHELWISGGGRLPGVPAPRLADVASAEWRPLLLELLVRLVAFDEYAYTVAALRGIHRLVLVDPLLDAQLVRLIRAAEPEVQRRILTIAETLACEEAALELRAWLSEQLESPRLDVALTAWGALRMAHGALGTPEPDWPPARPDESRIVLVARPLLIRPATRKGLYETTARASTSVLNSLEAAGEESVDDLRSELAASVREDPPAVRPRRARYRRGGDMEPKREDEAELERLHTILRERERHGRFTGVPRLRLAQALVPFVDPFVFLRTPATWASAETAWPVDDALDELVRLGSLATGAELARVLAADLPPGTQLIAGVVQSFSNKYNATVAVDHVVPMGFDHQSDRQPSVLNGRSSLLFEDPDTLIATPGSRDQSWLTWHVGGLYAFLDAQLEFFPGRSWKVRLEWRPEACDPLTWTRDGVRVAWFERRRGPMRRIYGGDLLYRQPTLGRWICAEPEWQRVQSALGAPRRRMTPSVAPYSSA